MKNDISFVFDFSLNLYEQQSTYNPNMPLRDLFYLSKVLQGMVSEKSLYGSTLIRIPSPRFVVFYNGTQEQPERQILRLSDAFEKPMEQPEIELMVTMLNINQGNNEDLLESCQVLKEYMLYVEKVRKYAETMPTREAVNRAVDECIREGILAEFLKKNKAEAIEMSIFEYDEAAHMKLVKEEGYDEGGLAKLITQIQKKLEKGLNAAQIADILEEDQSTIVSLMKLMEANPQKPPRDLSEIYLYKL